jgi:hypothetical protein
MFKYVYSGEYRKRFRNHTMYVYGMVDPRNGLVMYVGQSARPRQRFSQHRGKMGTPAMRAWLNELDAVGIEPELVTLWVVPPGLNVNEFEAASICMAAQTAERRGLKIVNRAGSLYTVNVWHEARMCTAA